MKRIFAVTVASAALAMAATGANAADGADFYKGKTVTYIVATGAGGGADWYGRLATRHMEKAMPGTTFIVRNVPGAGHIIGANVIYTSKPDGLTIGSFTTGLTYAQMVGQKGVKYDLAKMSWIGKSATDIRVLYMSAKSGYKTFDDVLKTKRTIKLGTSGVGSGAFNESHMIAHAFGVPIEVLAGYSGSERVMGMLRGEIDGQVGGLSSTQESTSADPGTIVLQFGDSLPNVPNAEKMVKTPLGKAIARFMRNQSLISRFVAGPPAVVPERLAALRAAYKTAFESKALLDEAKKAGRPIDPLYGEDVAELVREIISPPPEMTALLKQITSIKVKMLKNTGKVSAVVDGGRSFKVMEDGKELTVRISKSRTQITLGGKKAKRDKVKVGMTCEISWLKVNGEANLLACKE
jgi:tripartite-type tricarboxylate transporter receptor subunit TctC